jgi:hypothetical protein
MMKRNKDIRSILIFGLLILCFGCTEDPEPSLYNPNYRSPRPNPQITGVEPVDGTFAGIGEVTITGQNFSSNPAEVVVFFDGVPGNIISTSETEILVIAPPVSGDSVIIHVRIDRAMLFAMYAPYKLEIAAGDYGGLTDISDVYGIACDQGENLYVSQGDRKIVKITPQEDKIDYLTPDDGVDGFYKALKIGPGGTLFAIRTRFIYHAPAGQDTLIRIKRLAAAPTDIDFGPNGNIYYSANRGLYVFRPDESDEEIVDYPNINLVSVRVFNDYVYVAGKYTGFDTSQVQSGIWRNKILSADPQLDTTELVFDWNSYYEEQQAVAPNIMAITFAEDGDLYIGCDSTAFSDAIMTLHPDGNGFYLPQNVEPLFEPILTPPTNLFCWGTGQYLYVNRRSNNPNEKRVIRLTMGKNSAPYYGRQ